MVALLPMPALAEESGGGEEPSGTSLPMRESI